MNTKKLSILVLFLAGLSVVTWLIQRPTPPPGLDPRTGEPLVSRESLAAARTITLRNDGAEVTLRTDDDDGTWRVEGYYDFPVDFGKLSTLASNLQTATIIRLVTRNPQRMERLDLGNAELSIGAGGAAPALSLEIGKTAEGGGRFIRFTGEDKAYLTDLSLQVDATPRNWAQSRLLEFEAEDVAGIEIGFDGDAPPLALRRGDSSADWEVASTDRAGGVKPREVTNLLNRFTSLRFTETGAPESEEATVARQEARPLTIELFDGTRYTIHLGRRPAPPAPPPEEGPEDNTPTAQPPPAPKPGPVHVFIESNREGDGVNGLMARRSFQVSDFTYTSLPANAESILEPVPTPESEPDAPGIPEADPPESN